MARRVRTIREIEIKLRIADLPTLLRQIRRLGAVSLGRFFEQNILYDTPESDFRHRGRLLRLRIETPAPNRSAKYRKRPSRRAHSGAVLTSKVPVAAVRSRRYKEKLETEAIVSDPAAWRRAIKAMGLHEGFRYEKYRTSFRLSGAHLDLDETPVGVFLEIEGSPAAIDRVARSLGFAPRDYIRASYWDLYAADCRRRGGKIRNMLFRA